MTRLLDIQILNGLPDVFPYWMLKDRLTGYANPAVRIASLLSSNLIIRIRRGFYCLGAELRKQPLSLPLIAGMLHRESVVSLQYALSEYSMIPEAAMAVTSVTPYRSESAITPIGSFIWTHVPERAYGAGVEVSDTEPRYYVASREKALLDLIWTTEYFPKNQNQWSEYIFDDLRIDEEELTRLDSALMVEIACAYGGVKLDRFLKWRNRWLKRGE